MLSKNQLKLIQKLQQKKYRNELNLFIVEGKKSIVEFLQAGYRLELLIATEVFAEALSLMRVWQFFTNARKRAYCKRG